MAFLLGRSNRDQSRAFFKEGNTFRDRRAWQAAAQAYQNGLEISPDRFPIWVQLGNVLKEAGDLAGAKKAYERAHALGPEDADLHVQFGHFYNVSGNPAQARQHYENAVKLGSTDEEARRGAFVLHHPASAIAAPLQPEPAQVAPKRAVVEIFGKADALRDKRQWADAAAAYAEGLALDPDAFGMWVQMGHMLKEAGRMLEAEAAYTRALRLNPQDSDLMLQMGHLFALLDNSARACLFYAQSLSLGLRDNNAIAYLSRHPGDQSLVREAVARLLPESKRWKTLSMEIVSNNFTRFLLDVAT